MSATAKTISARQQNISLFAETLGNMVAEQRRLNKARGYRPDPDSAYPAHDRVASEADREYQLSREINHPFWR